MTHCMFARNASSSRAIPFSVTVKRVQDDPYMPRTFGTNQRGMQPAAPLDGWKLERARELWLRGRDQMVALGTEMAAPHCPHCEGKGRRSYLGMLGALATCQECNGTGEGLNVHKQLSNRLTETWQWITCAVTATWDGWSNYFALRCDGMAQEAIYDQAMMAQKGYFLSEPARLPPGSWHTPYLDPEEFNILMDAGEMEPAKVSVGRCARTSFLTQEGKRDFAEDLSLHDRLAFNTPMHASPLEHVCQAMGDDLRYGKYTGWKSYRHMIPGEYMTEFKPNHPDLVIATSV